MPSRGLPAHPRTALSPSRLDRRLIVNFIQGLERAVLRSAVRLVAKLQVVLKSVRFRLAAHFLSSPARLG